MPDIGWMELLVIGIVALIVVGPEDLPGMFKKLGQMVGRVRGMAKDFTNAMNDAADGSGMTEMTKDLRNAAKFTNPKAMAKDMMGDVMNDIDPDKYEDGSATKIIAEKKAASQAEARKIAVELREKRAARDREAAELSGEPEDLPAAEPDPNAPADPGPANVEVADTAPAAEPAPETERT
jgi:sec-independent protein translocase protein TatB